MRGDVLAAGLAVRECAPLAALLEGPVRPIGDVVLIDCPAPGGAALAALARIDVRAARSGARLVVSTSVAALDDVFACCDQSAPQILVEPSRAERVIALGRVLAEVPRLRVRELSEEDRLTLLRLTEQVTRLAERLEAFGGGAAASSGLGAESGGFRVESPSPGYRAPPGDDPADRLTRAARPPLPDPRLVRRIIRQRQLRARHFDGELFADPAWDMLLDLTAARAEHIRVSVTSLCIASGVPPTTALRWITQMSEAGLLQRVEDETDRRRAFIALTDRAAEAMARYFAELGRSAAQLV
ncbi:MAG: MarR family transcriptional regulator [Sphingomonadales bacterium 32-68-7]|nr:MAG: MarR family transcriptional regulator [Sphingomonadales bacterium 12-68-11]OYX07567.1 MAG: MarR family transcriptional regulator [Sphingomonadales bacterium 32-68-7]